MIDVPINPIRSYRVNTGKESMNQLRGTINMSVLNKRTPQLHSHSFYFSFFRKTSMEAKEY